MERVCSILVAIAKSEPSPGVAHLGERGTRQRWYIPTRDIHCFYQSLGGHKRLPNTGWLHHCHFSTFHVSGIECGRIPVDTCACYVLTCTSPRPLSPQPFSSILSSSLLFHSILVRSIPFSLVSSLPLSHRPLSPRPFYSIISSSLLIPSLVSPLLPRLLFLVLLIPSLLSIRLFIFFLVPSLLSLRVRAINRE